MSKKLWYQDQNFSISGTFGKRGVVMYLQTSRIYRTDSLSGIVELLQWRLPSILRSTCFNDQGFAFEQEVQNTEFGHLFEHILLEYLCKAKITFGARKAVYRGRTSWNWPKQEEGVFKIYVNAYVEDKILFLKALGESIVLMRQICNMGDQFRSPIFTIGLRRVENYSSSRSEFVEPRLF